MLVLKFKFLIQPHDVVYFSDQVLWTSFVEHYKLAGIYPAFFAFLAFINLLGQALFLNFLFVRSVLLEQKSYLPAITYILISSLVPEWNYFSLALLSNWLVLLMMYYLFQLNDVEEARHLIFNSAFSAGMATLILPSNIFLIIIVAVGMIVLRGSKLSEWLLMLVGFLLPAYIVIALFFLTDNIAMISTLLPFDFNILNVFNDVEWSEIMLPSILLVLFAFLGLFTLSRNSGTMLMRTKNLWLLIVVASIISLLGGFLDLSQGFYVWLPTLLLLSIIFTNIWLASYRKWILNLLFYASIAFTLYIQWF